MYKRQGIRRAKDALLKNGSPDLKFYPDNEEDNYTNAVIRINPEFYKKTTKETTKEITKTTKEIKKTTKETTKEKISIQEKMVFLMKNNPSITAEQIANDIKDITANGVRYHIRYLKSHGIIIREGSTKSGKWKVIK